MRDDAHGQIALDIGYVGTIGDGLSCHQRQADRETIQDIVVDVTDLTTVGHGNFLSDPLRRTGPVVEYHDMAAARRTGLRRRVNR